MAELKNCPKCNAIFNYNGLRDVCPKCQKEEEELFEQVYRFLRQRENRAATIERITEVTGASASLLHKWVRKRRLHPAQFPGLGYPCDNCGTLIIQGKICRSCTDNIKTDLKQHESNMEFREAVANSNRKTYLSNRDK
ncbi:TIGR03826 family flagellar region protein [Jeotgalibacillus haloalkalitolerans]|uniref:TIGR03826 family flagellar region protein n=1 Tax=Jeotgalibacillus haloalkalitolerans TaxID=3104292 RepID=A0ABU5KJR3_9BACL|nr:TIGR03826 family flagellar region protein [Jeotgalibacillus sp. HH7-29]MDZ5711468.1 TIGR03826 family flagellar region protein [Jeotgalibacillus sp. HH7-29]